MPTFDEYLAHFDADTHLMAAAAARGLEPDVPNCPDWTVNDLVTHTAAVFSQKAELIADGWADSWPPRAQLPDGVDPLEWYRHESARLYQVMSSADPAAPAMTFGRDRTVGFWLRRMAHETIVHRIDAEQGHGYESAIDLELAADGVSELFDVFLVGHPVWASFRPGADVARIEVGNESWTVRLGQFVGTRKGRDYVLPTMALEQDADPAVTITGEPDRLLLWMWGRADISEVAVNGDIEMATRFRSTCARRQTSGAS